MSSKSAKKLRRLAKGLSGETKSGYQKTGERSYYDKTGQKKTYGVYEAVNTETRINKALTKIYKSLPKEQRKDVEKLIKIRNE